jgi:AcrR family transcriptional regulator
VISSRERNARGSGGRLRDEIVTSALALLDETGSTDAITLRAVARGAGITAPSIYAHFADREAVVEAVVEESFQLLSDSLHAVIDPVADPVDRLHVGCREYLRFAAEMPHRYLAIFGHGWDHRDPAQAAMTQAEFIDDPGSEAFRILVDCIAGCVAAGRSTSTDAFFDAAALWSALHGYSTLHTNLPHFPWPDDADLLSALIDRLAKLTQ